MSKALIDLTRANKPTPPVEQIADDQAPTANNNEPAAAPIVAEPIAPPVPAATVEPVSTIGARIPQSLHQSIKLFCITHRLEMQQFVQDACEKHLADLQKANS